MILVAVTLLLLCMALALPVAGALAVIGLSLSEIYSPLPIASAIADTAWTANTSFLLASIPLYVLLGEILLRSGMADRMYNAIAQWLSGLPGGLMHANIGASALFASTCGSSVATAATLGTVALPQLDEHRYNEPLFLGSLAAGGTLGILIPPSINLIVFGVLTDTSIPQLYLAGVIPGVLLAAMFSVVIVVLCVVKRSWGGTRLRPGWAGRLRTLPDLLPPLVIFIVVVGSIYTGLATATESAAFGVVTALCLAALYRRLTPAMLLASLEGTARITAMIMLIVTAAFFLNFVLGMIGLTRQITQFVQDLRLGPYELILAIVALYIVLGCLMEVLTMMITTVTIVTPIVVAAGFDPVWFGIVIVILCELALITPPVGMNLFVIQGIRKQGPIQDVILGAVPFMLAIFAMLLLLTLWPGIATWLPRTIN